MRGLSQLLLKVFGARLDSFRSWKGLWRIQWPQPQRKGTGSKSLASWLLLVLNEQRLGGIREEMSDVSKERPVPCRFRRETLIHHVPLTILQVGNRPPRSFPTHLGTSKIFDSSNRLFHEVGENGTVVFHHSHLSPEACLEKLIYSIWYPGFSGNRQWNSIHRPKVPRFSCELQS